MCVADAIRHVLWVWDWDRTRTASPAVLRILIYACRSGKTLGSCEVPLGRYLGGSKVPGRFVSMPYDGIPGEFNVCCMTVARWMILSLAAQTPNFLSQDSFEGEGEVVVAECGSMRLHLAQDRVGRPWSRRSFQPVLESTRTYFDSRLSRKPARRRQVPAPRSVGTTSVRWQALRPRLSSPPTIWKRIRARVSASSARPTWEESPSTGIRSRFSDTAAFRASRDSSTTPRPAWASQATLSAACETATVSSPIETCRHGAPSHSCSRISRTNSSWSANTPSWRSRITTWMFVGCAPEARKAASWNATPFTRRGKVSHRDAACLLTVSLPAPPVLRKWAPWSFPDKAKIQRQISVSQQPPFLGEASRYALTISLFLEALKLCMSHIGVSRLVEGISSATSLNSSLGSCLGLCTQVHERTSDPPLEVPWEVVPPRTVIGLQPVQSTAA